MSGKNDGNDAEAICEAVGRPNMRFVPVKSAEQQAILSQSDLAPSRHDHKPLTT
jgi:transposase